ncbi:MAG: hypothetical protein JXB46_08285 [Candidatus Eisenbacteria bacterium]|nr:hypothetical protein [Candidatus Eisenbacteria bacterium]
MLRPGAILTTAILLGALLPGYASAVETIVLNEATDAVSVSLAESNGDAVILEFELGSFSVDPVVIDGRTYQDVRLASESQMLRKGLPALPDVRRSVVIPDDGEMRVTVVSQHYRDFPGIDVAPSRGPISRSVDPRTVAYEFDGLYGTDTWFPTELAYVEQPYIMRDIRGMTVVVNPFRYNSARRILRVYDRLSVRVERVGPGGANVLDRRPAGPPQREFAAIYERHFLNYDREAPGRYDSIGEIGNMLIICYGDFMEAMEPFVEWKKQMGVPCEMVSVTEAGGTSAAIRDFIQDYYDTEGVTFVLLVGDAAQVPTAHAHSGSSDPTYALVAGTDAYPDLFLGRFSAETVAQVQTQVTRSIEYEMSPQPGADWYHMGAGVASNLGPGDDGESDDEHIDNIRTDLLSYTYTDVDRIYDPGASSAAVTAAVNDGRGIINYTGHGATAGWVTSGFDNGDVNALTNDNMLPYIWSVACFNGAFEFTTCFAETWMRATNGSEPTGAIATYMSSISQDWDEPMDAQDEMVDLLVAGEKRTFGGLAVNGACHMLDQYGVEGEDDALTWHIFGDPSVRVRTDTPWTLTVTHSDVADPAVMTFEVEVAGVEGALCALYHDGVLYGSALTDPGGLAAIHLDSALPGDADVTVTVTAPNAIPYFGSVYVGEVYAPAIDISPGSFTVSDMPIGGVASDTLMIENVGEPQSVLHYSIEVVDAGMSRASDGSTVTVFPDACAPGSTLDLSLQLTNEGRDGEWIDGARLRFPEGVTLNWSTDFTVGSRALSSQGVDSNGTSVGWQGDWWNVVYPGETATATVNVTVDETFHGDMGVIFNLYGDGYGSPPHSVSGTVNMACSTPCPLVVLSPNGSEVWGVGETREIEWEPTGGPLEVNILCSTDGGGSWSTVIAGTGDDGSYMWPVCTENSDDCLIRVCLSNDQSVGDTSDRSFSVYEPVEWLAIFPASGDVPVGSRAAVELTFDATQLEEGEYQADLIITSNGGGPVVVPITMSVVGTGVDDRVPGSVVLYGNFPNPFNQSTGVAFSLPETGSVTFSVYTVDGRLVRAVPGESYASGRHVIVWDGKDDAGRGLPGGVYFYRLAAAGKELRGKMVMMR